MMQIDIPLARLWEFKVPRIIRYMNTNFIEDFFEHGKIMLTTYERCRAHEDKTRRDVKEGSCNFNLTHEEMGVAGIHTAGINSYMLCCSTAETANLLQHFECDNYLIINDVIGFADAISRYIPGFISGKAGCCIYKDERLVDAQTKTPITPNPQRLLDVTHNGKPGDIEEEFHRMNSEFLDNISRELADTAYFVKEANFSKELEFRIIWTTTRKVLEPLHIECPEAIKYCNYGKPLSRTINPSKMDGDGRMTVIAGHTEPPNF